MPTTMPMFPLGTALLPGGVLPLHVFEPRYRQMVQDLLAADGTPEFGQVLITRGHEVGGGEERATVGTIGQIVRLDALDGGRYALVAIGTRRIQVVRWLDDDPYPRAEVEDWPDDVDDPPHPTAVAAAAARVATVLALAAAVERTVRGAPAGEDPSPRAPEADASRIDVAGDPVAATYQLAAVAPLGPADRYRLLAAVGPTARLTLLATILDDVEAALRFQLS